MAITVRTTPQIDRYLDGAKSKSAKAAEAIECWLACETHARRTLKGKFTVNELCAFIDLMNSTIIPVAFSDSLRHEFEDGCAFDGLDAKWNLDKAGVLAKLDTLGMAEYIVLVKWCHDFWEENHWERPSPEDYTKQLA